MRIALALVVACGGSSPPPPVQTTTPPSTAPASSTRERPAIVKDLHKEELAAAHREKLDEQSTALAATCEKDAPVEQRCFPSCYAPEPADTRAGKKSPRATEITHVVCTRGDEGPYAIVGELGGALKPVRGRFPKPNKKGTWQADVEAAVTTALQPELARGDVVRVTSMWKPTKHPITRERMRCVNVSRYARAVRRPLDDCGGNGAITCEAKRNAAAHGINVVHYRLLEAQQLQKDGKQAECQQAALEAIAVARGMPRWRQYMSLNTTEWKASARYRTRFDGILDEDTLFSTAIALGTDAENVYVACGGAANPKTTAQQEQSFHTCW